MTRCGSPEFRAQARTWPSSVRRPRRNDALVRPMRELEPPARMLIPQIRVFVGSVLAGRTVGTIVVECGSVSNNICEPDGIVLRRSVQLGA